MNGGVNCARLAYTESTKRKTCNGCTWGIGSAHMVPGRAPGAQGPWELEEFYCFRWFTKILRDVLNDAILLSVRVFDTLY